MASPPGEGDLLYFGGDRFQTQGTATFGVWFLQSGVTPKADGTFSGAYQDGDLHIVADFQSSGANSAVIIREWVGDDATGSLQFLAGGEFSVDCVGPPIHPSAPDANSEFCATANLVNTNSPWAFQSSSGPANVWLPGLFFEGGIDLAALDLEDKCFSNTMIVTRSSNETTAQLKDFVAGISGFRIGYGHDAPTPAPRGAPPNTSVSDTAVVTSTGVNTFGGTVSFYLRHLGGRRALHHGRHGGERHRSRRSQPAEGRERAERPQWSPIRRPSRPWDATAAAPSTRVTRAAAFRGPATAGRTSASTSSRSSRA